MLLVTLSAAEMSLGQLLQLWCLLVVVNVASTAENFTYGGVSFTYFPTEMTWPQAVLHCVSEGLHLAKPGDDIAVGLRQYMEDNIKGQHPWISGGGDGVGALRWSRPGGGAVTPSGPVVPAHLIEPGDEGDWQSRNCLVLYFTYYYSFDDSDWISRPYHTWTCSSHNSVLCQERGIKKVELFSLKYKTDTAKVNSRPASTKVTYVTNNSDLPQDSNRVIEVSYQTSRKWEHNIGGKAGVETTVSTGIPFFAKGEVKVGFEANYAYTWGTTKTETNTDQIRAKVTVPAKSRQSVWVTYKRNTIDIPYIAIMKIYYVDGGSIIREGEPGVFKGVDAAEFHVMYGETESLE